MERLLADIRVAEGVPDLCLPSPLFLFFCPVWNTSRQESSSFPTLDSDPAETGQQIQMGTFVGGVNIGTVNEEKLRLIQSMRHRVKCNGSVYSFGFKCRHMYLRTQT